MWAGKWAAQWSSPMIARWCPASGFDGLLNLPAERRVGPVATGEGPEHKIVRAPRDGGLADPAEQRDVALAFAARAKRHLPGAHEHAPEAVNAQGHVSSFAEVQRVLYGDGVVVLERRHRIGQRLNAGNRECGEKRRRALKCAAVHGLFI